MHNGRTRPDTSQLLVPTVAEIERYGEPAYDPRNDPAAIAAAHMGTEPAQMAVAIIEDAITTRDGKKVWRAGSLK